MVFCTKNLTKREKMPNTYMSKQSLELFAQAQQSLGISYTPGKIDVEDSIVLQSIEILEGYTKGELNVASADVSILENMSKHLLHILRGPLYQKVFALHQKLSKDIAKLKEDNAKLADFNAVVAILNNKKQAQKLSMENLVQAKKIIDEDKDHSVKQKQRPMQQLQSYALLKYAELKQENTNMKPYKNFMATFGLSYQKTNNLVKKQMPVVDKKVENKAKKQNVILLALQKSKNAIATKFQQVKKEVKRFYDKYEPLIAFGTLMTIAVGGWKAMKSVGTDESFSPYSVTSNVVQNPVDSLKNEKIADFKKAQVEMNVKKETVQAQNQPKKESSSKTTTVASDYYDTSLQIHLGSKEAVQNLYNKIDSLAQAGKIKFAEGLGAKRYAHSFTMYKLIRPNSAENKAIQNLLNGGNENPDLINRLVLKAKAKGEGIKPDNNSITNSNFDNAAKSLQLQHLKNLQMQR